MLRAVIKKEILNHLVSFRFQISSIVMLVLAVLAAIVGSQDYRLRQARYLEHLTAHQQEMGRTHVYSNLHPSVFKAPEPLSVLDRGFDARLGNQVSLDVFTFPRPTVSGSHGEDWISVGDFDLTTIVRVVLGLLALLLTFDTVSGERERSTLRLIFSHSVARWAVIAGKFLGAFLALSIPLLASFGVSLLILREFGDVELDSGRWLRVIGLLGAYVGYLAVMLLVGIHLSLLSRSSSSSLVYSLVSWLAIVFLIPQSAVAVATAVHGGGALRSHRLVLDETTRERDRKFGELSSEFLKEHDPPFQAPVADQTARRGNLLRLGSPSLYDGRVEYFAREVEVGIDFSTRMEQIHLRGDEKLRQAETLARILASPSPAFLLDRISESFAGTSYDDHDRFLAASRQYREVFIEYLETKNAFRSWRWFTDDSPNAPQPWTTLFGVQPEQIAAEDIQSFIDKFQSEEAQDRIGELKLQFASDPERRLDLSDLPAIKLSGVSPMQSARRVAIELGVLFLLGPLLATSAFYRFAKYPVR